MSPRPRSFPLLLCAAAALAAACADPLSAPRTPAGVPSFAKGGAGGGGGGGGGGVPTPSQPDVSGTWFASQTGDVTQITVVWTLTLTQSGDKLTGTLFETVVNAAEGTTWKAGGSVDAAGGILLGLDGRSKNTATLRATRSADGAQLAAVFVGNAPTAQPIALTFSRNLPSDPTGAR